MIEIRPIVILQNTFFWMDQGWREGGERGRNKRKKEGRK